MELTHGSLFTGRGGIDEGAEAAGFKTVYTCEIDSYCRKILKQNFPDATHYKDIRSLTEVEKTTVISAGFPCQNISLANTATADGLQGEKSSLFFEAIRIICKAMPGYVVMENSPALLVRGMHDVLAAFTKIGYMCEWQCLRASDFGYPHKRERIYIIAYPLCKRRTSTVFKPISSVKVHGSWSSTQAYLRVSGSRAEQHRNSTAICNDDVVPDMGKILKSYGNAVMPVIAEYIFKCIKMDIEATET